MLTELDTVLGPLSLTSTMSSMVHYTRQGVYWLRLDSQKVKWPTTCCHCWIAATPLCCFSKLYFTSACLTVIPTWTAPQACFFFFFLLYVTWTSLQKVRHGCHLMFVFKARFGISQKGYHTNHCTCYLFFSLVFTFLSLSGTLTKKKHGLHLL